MSHTTLRREERTKTQSDCDCDWCGKVIRRGERYVYSSNIYDDNFYPWRAHMHCDEWANALFRYDREMIDDGIPRFGLIEALDEYRAWHHGD